MSESNGTWSDVFQVRQSMDPCTLCSDGEILLLIHLGTAEGSASEWLPLK